jgi:uncharacterized membrane protein YeiH
VLRRLRFAGDGGLRQAAGETLVTDRGPSVAVGRTSQIVMVADLAGTALFGAEGALAAVADGLDLLGVAVLALVTALGGGMLRDVLGATPPAALHDRRYLLAALAGGAAGALAVPAFSRAGMDLVTVDALGLALFAVAGTQKALGLGFHALTCILLGTLTPTGGGMLGAVLANHVPAILRVEFYATAALVGAAVLVLLRRLGAPARMSAVLAGAVCFGLRMAGAALNWHLTVIRLPLG